MTEVDDSELATLLDDVRRELGVAVDELERSRAAHRAVESMLLAVLEHVPVPLVIVDGELRVRAASSAAEAAWGATVDAPVSGLDELDDNGVVDACRSAVEIGHVAASSLPEGFGAALLDEPGTSARYVVVWSG
jgi:PAS domain-containing protein